MHFDNSKREVCNSNLLSRANDCFWEEDISDSRIEEHNTHFLPRGSGTKLQYNQQSIDSNRHSSIQTSAKLNDAILSFMSIARVPRLRNVCPNIITYGAYCSSSNQSKSIGST